MKRSPLKRKSRLKPHRSAPRKSGRVLWPEYLDLVREYRCYACVYLRYDEPLRHTGQPYFSEADHQGEHPYGRKADDDTAVPMCEYHHRLRTDGFLPDESIKGYKRAGKAEMRKWCDEAIAATQAELLPILAARGVKNPKEEA